jgi:hypothetical protein
VHMLGPSEQGRWFVRIYMLALKKFRNTTVR